MSSSYVIIQTSKFKSDLRRAAKRGLNMSKLTEVVGILAMGKKLDSKYRDHMLKGEYAGMRECHIAPDWLLIYEKRDNILMLKLVRTGTHRELGIGG